MYHIIQKVMVLNIQLPERSGGGLEARYTDGREGGKPFTPPPPDVEPFAVFFLDFLSSLSSR